MPKLDDLLHNAAAQIAAAHPAPTEPPSPRRRNGVRGVMVGAMLALAALVVVAVARDHSTSTVESDGVGRSPDPVRTQDQTFTPASTAADGRTVVLLSPPNRPSFIVSLAEGLAANDVRYPLYLSSDLAVDSYVTTKSTREVLADYGPTAEVFNERLGSGYTLQGWANTVGGSEGPTELVTLSDHRMTVVIRGPEAASARDPLRLLEVALDGGQLSISGPAGFLRMREEVAVDAALAALWFDRESGIELGSACKDGAVTLPSDPNYPDWLCLADTYSARVSAGLDGADLHDVVRWVDQSPGGE